MQLCDPDKVDTCGNYVPGDVNNDKLLNVQDVVLLVNIITTTAPLQEDDCVILAADSNSDNAVDILDAVAVILAITSGK